MEVRCHVVGNIEIRPAIIVRVTEDDTQAVTGGSAKTRLFCGVAKGSTSVVREETVGEPPIDVGVAVGAQTSLLDATQHIVVIVEIDIVRDIEIQVTIQIHIGKGGRRSPTRVSHACLFGRITKGAVAVIEL